MSHHVVHLVADVHRTVHFVIHGRRGTILATGCEGANLNAVAELAVITIQQFARGTRSALAGVAKGARIAVLAGDGVVGVDTPYPRFARIVGADVFIVAVDRRSIDAGAHAAAAHIPGGTSISVIARQGVGAKDTAGHGVARIVGAVVVVVAGHDAYGDAQAQLAVVAGGANVVIVTRGAVEHRYAPGVRVAVCVGADVAVVLAHNGLTGKAAEAGSANLQAVARIAVVTSHGIVGDAAIQRVAHFDPVAGVCVAALERLPRLAARGDVTGFLAVTNVRIITHQRIARNTHTFRTGVTGGADVAIFARVDVIGLHAADQRVTGVVGAAVAVVAVQGDAGFAHAGNTFVTDGAQVAVFARETFVIGHEGALAGGRVARGLQADRIGAGFGGRTRRHRFRVRLAEEGQFGGVAHEGAVAQVAVFQRQAVGVDVAVAVHGKAGALTLVAGVVHGAWVLVVAGGGIVLGRAAAQAVAQVIGANVTVVTAYGLADAIAGFAMVADGAGVAVQAFTTVKLFILTAFPALTGVQGAVVAVVANRSPFHQVHLVHQAVAVIIKGVADLPCRFQRVAVGQSLFRAHPFALARAEFVAELAVGKQPQFHRGLGARTKPGFGHTLFKLDAVHGGCGLARESPRTFFTLSKGTVTGAAAEVSPFPITDARILGAGRSCAICGFVARPAQVGEVGDTDEDNVRVARSHLTAHPPLGTFLLAGAGAYFLAHVLDAPAGQAVRVFLTFVQEASLARVAGRLRADVVVGLVCCRDVLRRGLRRHRFRKDDGFRKGGLGDDVGGLLVLCADLVGRDRGCLGAAAQYD